MAKQPNLLILGGTNEARRLAEAVAARGWDAVLSYAGRTAAPRAQPVPIRIGGFGGVAGLAAYLRAEQVTHLIDATHPFAATMSRNAVTAAEVTGVPLAALTRPPWHPAPGDDWIDVPSMDAAVEALERPATRVFLAIGRQELGAFAGQVQHDYLLRLVDPPAGPLPLPRCTVVVDRGPFDVAGDTALLQQHDIQLVVAKNAGGEGARAKLEAARTLGLPVVMVARPAMPERLTFHDPDALLDWVAHPATALGV
ncbi:MAG: cobalt-precorrin-6A reductase [Pseudomonadota bacterium]